MNRGVILHANKYVEQGFSIIPILPGEKEPAVPWKEFQHRRPTREELRQFFLRGERNIAIVTGQVSGITVVDIDNVAATLPNQEEEKRKKIISMIETTSTLKVRTPRQGVHAYFRYIDRIQTGPTKIGIDIKNDGGYVLAPPSRTRHGNYEFIADVEIAEMPAELVRLIIEARKDTSHAIQTQTESLIIAQGMRNSYLASVAGSLRRRGIQQEEILKTLLLLNEKYCQPALQEKEVETIARSICRYEPAGITEITQSAEQEHEAIEEETRETEEETKNAEEENKTITVNDIAKQIVVDYEHRKICAETDIETDHSIVEQLFFTDTIAMLSGMGGVGKSTLLYQLATCVAYGIDFLGLKTKKANVLYIDAEETRRTYAPKIAKIIQKLHVKNDDKATYIHIFLGEISRKYGLVDYQLFVDNPYQEGVEITRFGDMLRAICNEYHPRLVIIDPFAYIVQNENDNAHICKLYNYIKLIAPNSCILFAHHQSKAAINSDSNTRTKARGAIAMTENAKTHLVMEKNLLYIDKCNYNHAIQGATLHINYDDIFTLLNITHTNSTNSAKSKRISEENDPF